jgi:mono/diheme cytochrome c family protein
MSVMEPKRSCHRRPLLAPAALVALAAAACTGKYVRHTSDERVEPTPGRLARGEYLVQRVAACGACHTARESGRIADAELPDRLLAGGNVLETISPRMKVWVPNITSDADTGVGGWSDDQLARAIRDGVDDEGELLSPLMPFDAYRHLSDDDVRAVIAYLRSVPKVRQDRKPSKKEVPFFVHVGLDWLGMGRHRPAKDVAAPPSSDRMARGRYLFDVAGCADCHSLGSRGARGEDDRWLAGSDVPFPEGGRVWASNITPDADTGIGRATAERLKKALREGVRLDGKKMAPPMSTLAAHYAGMTEEDLDALVAYLLSVKPVRHHVPARQLDPETRARIGEP